MPGTLILLGCRFEGGAVVVCGSVFSAPKSNGQRRDGTLIRRRPFRAVASRVPCRRKSANCIIHRTHRSDPFCVYFRFGLAFFLALCIYGIGTRLWGGNRGRSNSFRHGQGEDNHQLTLNHGCKLGLGLNAGASRP
ncbi:hypothetical protein F5144DRAFT_308896 [Chaetomium tenue]|uniref:Uncharacterized protein n=1 Tax=Chaetomium tenue TaxID=1854479 RepID=A0ACB7P3G6_9PEZI|nr:hypothetical protein F5144DRAFT_308896 [Chaetomium globosum]